MSESGLAVFSGRCCKGVIGTPVEFKDMNGVALHVGDIVQTFTVKSCEDDDGEWLEMMGASLTAVVDDEWISYSDGTHIKNPSPRSPYVMGISSVPMHEPGKWRVRLVKSHRSVIEGEHWPEYGFSYRAAPDAKATGAQP